MKQYIKNIIRFSVLSIFIYIIGLVVWGMIPYSYIGSNFLYRQGSYGHLNTRVKEIPRYGKVDILFVGSSRVYRGFDPRIFEKQGLKIFVLGSSRQTPLQSYVLLKRYLDHLKPELVVFDMFPSSFSIKGVEPTLDLLANDTIDRLSFQMAMDQNDLMVWNTFIYASIMQVAGIHDNFEEPIHKPREHDTYISGGYVYKNLLYKEHGSCEQINSKEWSEPLELQVNYFKKMTELLDKRENDLICINMPLEHYNCYKNNDILEEYIPESAKYFDFNILLNFNDSLDFYDEYHLNNRGIKKLNYFLLNNITILDTNGETK